MQIDGAENIFSQVKIMFGVGSRHGVRYTLSLKASCDSNWFSSCNALEKVSYRIMNLLVKYFLNSMEQSIV